MNRPDIFVVRRRRYTCAIRGRARRGALKRAVRDGALLRVLTQRQQAGARIGLREREGHVRGEI